MQTIRRNLEVHSDLLEEMFRGHFIYCATRAFLATGAASSPSVAAGGVFFFLMRWGDKSEHKVKCVVGVLGSGFSRALSLSFMFTNLPFFKPLSLTYWLTCFTTLVQAICSPTGNPRNSESSGVMLQGAAKLQRNDRNKMSVNLLSVACPSELSKRSLTLTSDAVPFARVALRIEVATRTALDTTRPGRMMGQRVISYCAEHLAQRKIQWHCPL